MLKNFPKNSTMRYDMVVPYELLKAKGATNEEFGSNSIMTFVKLRPGTPSAAVDAKIKGFIKKRVPDSATDLVPHPTHAALIGAHVGAEDVLLDLGQRTGKATDQFFFLLRGHRRVTVEHRLATAVGQVRRGVLKSHGPRQPKALLRADIRRHPDPADRRPPGHVIHHQRPPQVDGGLVHLNDLEGAQVVVGDAGHGALPNNARLNDIR